MLEQSSYLLGAHRGDQVSRKSRLAAALCRLRTGALRGPGGRGRDLGEGGIVGGLCGGHFPERRGNRTGRSRAGGTLATPEQAGQAKTRLIYRCASRVWTWTATTTGCSLGDAMSTRDNCGGGLITGEGNGVTSKSRGRLYSLHVRMLQIRVNGHKYDHHLRTGQCTYPFHTAAPAKSANVLSTCQAQCRREDRGTRSCVLPFCF